MTCYDDQPNDQTPDEILRDAIYNEVLEEREYQESKWNGLQSSVDDWSAYMAEYALGCSDRTIDRDPRERWVKVAALAFAAIEDYEKGRIIDIEDQDEESIDDLVDEISDDIEDLIIMLDEVIDDIEDDDFECNDVDECFCDGCTLCHCELDDEEINFDDLAGIFDEDEDEPVSCITIHIDADDLDEVLAILEEEGFEEIEVEIENVLEVVDELDDEDDECALCDFYNSGFCPEDCDYLSDDDDDDDNEIILLTDEVDPDDECLICHHYLTGNCPGDC